MSAAGRSLCNTRVPSADKNPPRNFPRNAITPEARAVANTVIAMLSGTINKFLYAVGKNNPPKERINTANKESVSSVAFVLDGNDGEFCFFAVEIKFCNIKSAINNRRMTGVVVPKKLSLSPCP